MRSTFCPFCLNTVHIDDREWGTLVECDGPGCTHLFHAGGGRGAPDVAALVALPAEPVATQPRPVETYGPAGPVPLHDPEPEPGSAPPLLTGPHRCAVCRGEIHEAFGLRRHGLTHHDPARAESCRTDVYAAIYHCPVCRVLLETPAYQWSSEVQCPHCTTMFIAPRDDVLHRHEGDARADAVFLFPCPACTQPLRCDATREGQPTTGLYVVCIHFACRHRIEIPMQVQRVARAGGPAPSLPLPSQP